MLDILLSHWAIYMYAVYVLVMLVLCIVLRPKTSSLSRSLHDLHSHAWKSAYEARVRQFR